MRNFRGQTRICQIGLGNIKQYVSAFYYHSLYFCLLISSIGLVGILDIIIFCEIVVSTSMLLNVALKQILSVGINDRTHDSL